MKRVIGSILAMVCAAVASASSPKVWTTDSAREFSTGTARGVSALPNGDLALTRTAVKIDDLAATKFFAAATEKSGAIVFATGDEGTVYRQEPGRPATTLLTLPEKEVTAVAVGPDGAIYAGTSPHGRVYRIERGKPLAYFEPKAEYIWAFAFGPHDTLFVATGLPGRIFRVTAPGEGEVFHDAGDEHVRCLYLDPQGRLWAGTSGKGLLLRISPDGRARTIYDSEKAEISSIDGGPKGEIWAAAVSARTSGGPPPAPRPPAAAPPKEKKPDGSAPAPGEGDATVTVTATTSLAPPPAAPAAARAGDSSELVEVGPDDFPSPIWRSEDELIYSCRYDPDSAAVLVGTGPRGRVYLIRRDQVSLSATADEKRVVLATPGLLVTDSPASAYRRVPARAGEYFSTIKDTGRPSRFGAFRVAASIPKGSALALSFRSGNSSFPDATWAPWSEPGSAGPAGRIAAPPGRFLQWKASLSAESPERSPRLSRIECAYQNENAGPQVEAVAVGTTGREPAGAFAPPSTDENAPAEGIFAAADEKPAASRGEGRGALVVTWKASDPDGDEILADIDFRPVRGDAWMPMRRGVRGNSFGFDSRLLPDGRYEFRVTVSDRAVNAEDPKGDAIVSDPVVIDNTPPVITLLSAGSAARGGSSLRVRVVDALSPVAAVGWSVNAGPWTRASADDGMTDSPEESYTISVQRESRGAYVLIRAVDAAGNTSSLSVVVP